MGSRTDLERCLLQIEALGAESAASADFIAWRASAEKAVADCFGPDSAEAQDFAAIYFTPYFLSCRMGDEAFDEAYRKGLAEAKDLLEGLLSKRS